MKLKESNPPVTTTGQSGGDNWQTLSNQLNSPSQVVGQEGGEEDDESESPKLDNDRNLTTAQLADSALDNVVTCSDCSRPVLQASLSDHQAICPNSKNPGNLKRKLSEDSTSQPPKKSKITLHFNSSTNSPDPTSTKPSPSPVPPLANPSSSSAAPGGPTSVPLTISASGGPSAAGLDKKNKRVVDPDRQCGVINERGLPCQRSLTCKTHNMTAKRAVPHRSQPFDSLLIEWQKASRLGKEREALTKSLRDGSNLPGVAQGGVPGQVPLLPGGLVPGGEDVGGTAAGKKEKKKKNSNLSTLTGLPGLDSSSSQSLLQPNTLLPNASTSTSTKKSKKPNASNSSNSQTFYYVGEAPPPANGGEGGGVTGQGEEEEESDYLSSSDEVESVLLSLQKLTKRTTTTSTPTMTSPLVMREGGGSGFSSASWWTGRNRKLMRLRGLGLDSVFGGGASNGNNASSGAGNAKR